MFKALFGRKVNADHAHALYGTVVARARDTAFYSKYGVPDTFDGRFEMLVMHLFLVHNRLKDESLEERKISQLIFDAFIDDMDSALREAAVGDQTVPKRIAKMTRVFYGRTGAYESAFAEATPQKTLQSVIGRNLYPDDPSNRVESNLAAYIVWQYNDLAGKSATVITRDHTIFEGPLLNPEAYDA